MINKEKLTSFAKRVFKKEKNLSSHRIMHPKREWLIGLFVAALLFIGTAGWSTHTYISFRDFTPNSTDLDNEPAVVYRESLVEKALEEYRVRQQTYNELLNQNTAVENIEVDEELLDPGLATTSTSSLPTPETSTSSTEANQVNEEEMTPMLSN